MRLPAAGTAAGTGKSPAVLEYEAAFETFARQDGQFASCGRQRAGNMRQVFVYFLFLDAYLPRYFPGIHFLIS